ncbi:MAG: hypothetical protein ABMA01_04290 [Chthoniobacteraceae bacterium]
MPTGFLHRQLHIGMLIRRRDFVISAAAEKNRHLLENGDAGLEIPETAAHAFSLHPAMNIPMTLYLSLESFAATPPDRLVPPENPPQA